MVSRGEQLVVNSPKVRRKVVGLDRYAVQPDAFGDGDQVRRAEEAGPIAVGAQD